MIFSAPRSHPQFSEPAALTIDEYVGGIERCLVARWKSVTGFPIYLSRSRSHGGCQMITAVRGVKTKAGTKQQEEQEERRKK